ncbi:MAG TPA: homocysteine S-methyltransferase family protein, partial [Polyangiaceae bacterium]|nr:homocysteine S-methyltransferase family protein [Polyangiaceae bacterium]
MTFRHVQQRLQAGRPLVVAADSNASLRARGVALDVPGALGQLLRERPGEVREHYRVEVGCRADVLAALTGDTTPRALAEVGMEHRAAQLTARAVELALDAADESAKPVAVAGVLGSDMVSPVAATRLHEELSEHSARLAAAGCELLIARGQGSRLNLMAAVVAATLTELPTWAVIERTHDAAPVLDHDLFRSLRQAGASVVLFEVSSVVRGLAELVQAREGLAQAQLTAGILLA